MSQEVHIMLLIDTDVKIIIMLINADNGTDCDSIGSNPGLAIPNFHSWKASKTSQEAEVV